MARFAGCNTIPVLHDECSLTTLNAPEKELKVRIKVCYVQQTFLYGQKLALLAQHVA